MQCRPHTGVQCPTVRPRNSAEGPEEGPGEKKARKKGRPKKRLSAEGLEPMAREDEGAEEQHGGQQSKRTRRRVLAMDSD